MIDFRCPCCSAGLQVDDALAGQPSRCPTCQEVSRVPKIVDAEPIQPQRPTPTRKPQPKPAPPNHGAPKPQVVLVREPARSPFGIGFGIGCGLLVALALGGCGIALLLSPPVALPRHSSIPGLKAGDICHAASSSGFIWAAPDRWSLEDYLKLTAANDQQG